LSRAPASDASPVASLAARGVVCAFGASEETLWQGLLSGETRVVTREEEGQEVLAARVPDGALTRAAAEDRCLSLIREAALQIQQSRAWAELDPCTVGVCVGTTQGTIHTWQRHQQRLALDPAHQPPAPGMAAPALEVARLLGTGGPLECPSMACVSGTAAIGMGLSWIRRGLCDAVVAGGVDALSLFVYQGFACLKALDPQGPRPFDRDRAGLGLGEGAGLVLLVRGRRPGKAAVKGWGLGSDANHLTGPHPEGEGAARALARSLADAGEASGALDFLNAHGTGTVYNDQMETRALQQVLGPQDSARLPVNSIKGALGHTMGAAGAIEAILCALVLERGLAPPTANLVQVDPKLPLNLVRIAPRPGDYRCVASTASGFGGLNAALTFIGPA